MCVCTIAHPFLLPIAPLSLRTFFPSPSSRLTQPGYIAESPGGRGFKNPDAGGITDFNCPGKGQRHQYFLELLK